MAKQGSTLNPGPTVRARAVSAFMNASTINDGGQRTVTLEDLVAATEVVEVPAETPVLLCHFDGEDAATEVLDEVGTVVWHLDDGAALSQAQAKFPSASLKLGGAAFKYAWTNSFANFGADDFTVEFFFRFTNSGQLIGLRISDSGGSNSSIVLTCSTGSAAAVLYESGSEILTLIENVTASLNAWHHLVLVNNGGVYSLGFDGVMVDTDTAVGTIDEAEKVQQFQEETGVAHDMWVDELRISREAKYTGSTYNVPFSAFGIAEGVEALPALDEETVLRSLELEAQAFIEGPNVRGQRGSGGLYPTTAVVVGSAVEG